MRTGGGCRTVDREISRFPSKELLHMPGSSTTPGRSDLAMVRPKRVAFRARNSVGTRGLAFAAQWLAYALPYRRFVGVLTDANARLGADVDRYSFIVVDLHHLLLAGLPAHFESSRPSQPLQRGTTPPSPIPSLSDPSFVQKPRTGGRPSATTVPIVRSSRDGRRRRSGL